MAEEHLRPRRAGLRSGRRPGAAALVVPVLLSLALAPAARAAEAEASPELESESESEPGAGLPAYETVVTAEPDAAGPRSRRIRRRELEARGERTAAGALEALPSLNASTGARGERIFTLRGFDQRQTSVLFDGVPLQLPYDGQMDLGMLPAEALEEIEVFRGPSATLAGAGLGGTVSLTPRRPGEAPTLALRAEGSLPQALRLSGAHGHRSGPVAWTLYGGLDQRDGFPLPAGFAASASGPAGLRLNSDRQGFLAGGGVAYELGEGRSLRLAATHLNAERGVPPSTVESDRRFWRFTAWRATLASLEHRTQGAWDLAQTLYVRSFDNLLDLYDDATYSSQTAFQLPHSWHHDRVVGLLLRGARAVGAEPGGLELRGRADAQYDEHLDTAGPKVSRALVGAAAEAELELGGGVRAVLSAPLQAELPLALPGEHARPAAAVDPLVSLRLGAREQASLGLLLARRHRFPTLKERFSRALGYLAPNPGLAPESALHVELDGTWRVSRALSLEASVFDAEVSGLIERVPFEGEPASAPAAAEVTPTHQLRNVGRARLAGMELGARVRLARTLRGELGYAFLDARRTEGTRQALQYRPAHKVTATAVLQPLRWVQLAGSCRFIGPQHFPNPAAGPEVWGTLGSYTLVDASLEVEPMTDLHLSVRATNLLDAPYQTEYGYPEPGRQLWAGLRLTHP